MIFLNYRRLRKSSTGFRNKQRLPQLSLLFLTITVTSLLLMSCQSLQPKVKLVRVSVARDLVFPTVPEVKANHASELTEAEYQALVQYVIDAEKVFDIIDSREAFLEYPDTADTNKCQ